jgi:hypothetical protein
MEKDKRRHSPYLKLAGSEGISIHVYFDDFHPVAHLPCRIFQDRLHHFARAAPYCEEVYQYRDFPVDQFLKCHWLCTHGGFVLEYDTIIEGSDPFKQ